MARSTKEATQRRRSKRKPLNDMTLAELQATMKKKLNMLEKRIFKTKHPKPTTEDYINALAKKGLARSKVSARSATQEAKRKTLLAKIRAVKVHLHTLTTEANFLHKKIRKTEVDNEQNQQIQKNKNTIQTLQNKIKKATSKQKTARLSSPVSGMNLAAALQKMKSRKRKIPQKKEPSAQVELNIAQQIAAKSLTLRSSRRKRKPKKNKVIKSYNNTCKTKQRNTC